MAENDGFSSRTIGKALEKSNFAQTCNLLSQFLKEKRSFVPGISGKPETKEKAETFRPLATTMNFLTNMENQAGTSSTKSAVAASPVVKSSDFFQQLVSSNIEDAPNKADLIRKPTTATTTTTKPETAQMTIFYGGQVLVFNDLPTDKANEVIALARKGSSNFSGCVSTTAKDKIDSANNVSVTPPESKTSVVPKSDFQKNKYSTQENRQERPAEAANGSDLPIARRNSLHRFLEKRKDRVASKAPYQVNNPHPVAASQKPADEGNIVWNQIQEGECSEQQLELKL